MVSIPGVCAMLICVRSASPFLTVTLNVLHFQSVQQANITGNHQGPTVCKQTFSNHINSQLCSTDLGTSVNVQMRWRQCVLLTWLSLSLLHFLPELHNLSLQLLYFCLSF